MENVKGRIHSFETFGTVDGPGIRFVVFMQGCNFRCLYCHNPDTWSVNAGEIYSPVEVYNKVKKYIPYLKSSGGGITISGGEPLLQSDFIYELFNLCKQINIHTCIDTNGCYNNLNSTLKLLDVTDLVLLDIKHTNKLKHKNLTQNDNTKTLELLKILSDQKIPTWIRYVVVPSYTDQPDNFIYLKQLKTKYKNIEKIELLPFHKMGEYKWQELEINYTLTQTPQCSDELLSKCQNILDKL